MKIHLLSTIKPFTKLAYEFAYNELYDLECKEVQGLLRWAKEQGDFDNRIVKQFIKNVIEVAEYEPTTEELKKWEFEELREKQLGNNA